MMLRFKPVYETVPYSTAEKQEIIQNLKSQFNEKIENLIQNALDEYNQYCIDHNYINEFINPKAILNCAEYFQKKAKSIKEKDKNGSVYLTKIAKIFTDIADTLEIPGIPGE
jgi:Zn-dependent M16 (insulinase) family peptidase